MSVPYPFRLQMAKVQLRIQVEVLAEKGHERAKDPQSIFEFARLERVGGCLLGCIVLGLGLHR